MAFIAGAMVLVGVLTFQQPMAVYALTDPGLDSGSATVDRTTVPGQTILKYTSGTSTFKAPAGVTSVRVLVVAGGGGGGAGELINQGDGGGGGGAGEYRHETSFAVTPGAAVAVTVGGGGAGSTTKQNDGGTTAQNGTAGNNSVFGTLTTRGGGGGGGNDQHGVAGGSGGGAGGHCTTSATSGGIKSAVAPGLGNNGGSSPSGSCTPRGAAGGGGAGAVGTNGSGSNGGTGAIGLQNDVTGANVFYAAGGGGGGSNSGTGANGGSSIGGKGGNGSGGSGTVGTASTGSGGGGGGASTSTGGGNGGNGGSGVVIVRFATQTINPPSPGGVSGLTMWYKADSAGNTNALWNDSSGFGYNLTQGTAAKQPVLTTNSINFNPAYVFDGAGAADDVFRMDSQGIGANEPVTAFYAALSTTSAGGYLYLNEFGDDTPSISLNNGKPDLYVRGTTPIQNTYATAETGIPHVYSFISPNANNQPRIVGTDDNEQSQNVTTGAYTTSSGGQAGNTFGSTNGSGGKTWPGPIGEALFFNKVLTPAERLKIISYLSLKYGVTRFQGASGMGYSDSSGTTIWSADSTFKNNIAGIGRDDASTLNQKQSKSSSGADILTIGHGTIAATNQANSNNFTADRSFQIWGNNGAATNQNTTIAGTTYVRMNRIWKVVTTGTVGQVKIQIPTSAVTTGNNGIMFVNTSATIDSGAQRVTMTQNGANYEATITLPVGTRYFSFGSLTGSDLQFVSKTATNLGGGVINSYTPGESIEYVLKVKNNGPDNAGLVTVTDTLPSGVTAVSATGGGWNCSIANPTVTCTRSALNTSITAPDIIIEVDIASSVTGAKNNTAAVSVANDPDTANNNGNLNLPATPKADLSLTKRSTNTPSAGQLLNYEFQVTNDGPSDVSGFTVTDTLDSSLTFESSSPNVNCAGTPLVCTSTGPLAAGGAPAIVTIAARVDAGFLGGSITNQGTVGVPVGTTDPNSGNNTSAQDTTGVDSRTDLEITKTHTGNFIAGENNNDFNVTVHNNGGPSTAPSGSITVTDILDEDFTFVPGGSGGTNWSCDLAGGSGSTVQCVYNAPLAPDADASPLAIRVAVDPIAKGATNNTAEVAGTTPDPNLANNSSVDSVTIQSESDLGITKGHVGTAFTPGQTEQYTFSVINNGPSADSPNYTITDNLPAGVTFVSTEPGSAASCVGTSGNTIVTCTGGAIGVGDPAQLTTINVAVGSGVTGVLNNSASVATAAGTTDPNPGNDSGADNNLSVEPNADLTISKTPSSSMTAGNNATYTLTAHNGGPSNISSYTVTDKLDPNLTLIPGGGCVVTTPDPTGDLVTCTGGAITNGNDGTPITMTVTLNKSTAPGSIISNTATVVAPSGVNDPIPGNNNGSVDRTVVASADLQITKSHTGDFTAGTNTNDFKIEVTNAGPSDSGPFTVNDVLPSGFSYVSAASTAGVSVTCNNSGPTVTCVGNPGIGAGQTSTITLTVAVDADIAGNTVINNTASVASATPDPDNGNNTTPADAVTVDSSADLEINKTHMTDFTAGNDEDYNIEVINNGPSDITGFTVTDTLPAGLTFVVPGSDPGCSAISQDVTCNGGALASGASVNITLRVNTDSGLTAGTMIDNTADVATIAPTTDPNPVNNSSDDSTEIVNVTDLSIQKNPVGTYTAGETGQFSFTVSNAGPSTTPINDVQVTDSLPGGMTYASFIGTGWDCAGSAGQSVSCDYAPALAASASTSLLTVTVNIAPDMQGSVQNTGSVLSRLDDSIPGNDNNTITVNVDAEANLTATKTPQGALTAGESVTYRFEVTNDGGPSIANNVTITDDLQDHFTYQSFAGVSGGTWDCGEASGIVTCTLPTLAVGATAEVDITVEVAEDAPNPVENTAAVTFSGTDPTPANPSTSDPVSYSADLEVDITHEQKAYHAGDTVNYTVTAINHGPSAAEDAVLTITIPEGLTLEHMSAEKPGGSSILSALDEFFFPRALAASNPFSCSLNGNKLVCTAGTMFVGSYPLYLTGKIGSSFSGQMVLAAHITSSTPDPNPSDATTSDTIDDVLAATGQNILVWIGAALAMVIAAIVIFIIIRRRMFTKGYN